MQLQFLTHMGTQSQNQEEKIKEIISNIICKQALHESLFVRVTGNIPFSIVLTWFNRLSKCFENRLCFRKENNMKLLYSGNFSISYISPYCSLYCAIDSDRVAVISFPTFVKTNLLLTSELKSKYISEYFRLQQECSHMFNLITVITLSSMNACYVYSTIFRLYSHLIMKYNFPFLFTILSPDFVRFQYYSNYTDFISKLIDIVHPASLSTKKLTISVKKQRKLCSTDSMSTTDEENFHVKYNNPTSALLPTNEYINSYMVKLMKSTYDKKLRNLFIDMTKSCYCTCLHNKQLPGDEFVSAISLTMLKYYVHKIQSWYLEILKTRRRYVKKYIDTILNYPFCSFPKNTPLATKLYLIRKFAATIIQKVIRGYLARKYFDLSLTHWIVHWKYSLKTSVVQITGSFTNPPYKVIYNLSWNPVYKHFTIVLPRFSGLQKYRFIINGKFCCDKNYPIIITPDGIYWNVQYFSS